MNKKGFTLLEVTLFLTISSALALIAFAGLGPRIRNVRFTGSVRAIESAVKNQFAASSAGVNQRPNGASCVVGSDSNQSPKIVPTGSATATDTGGSGTCVINGKLLVFEENRLMAYSIVSYRQRSSTVPASTDCDATDFSSILTCYKPRVVLEVPTPTVFSYPGGALMTSETTIPLAFGYIQDPNSTAKHQFFYTPGTPTSPQANITASTTSFNPENKSTCLSLDGRTAKMSFTLSSQNLKTEFGAC